jgi:F-type H+-transporting ATPase subunit b
MPLLLPQLGLFFWTLVIFLTFFFILRRFAWSPILKALKAREDSIDSALRQADQARKELGDLTARNEAELLLAREERQRILLDAENLKRSILEQAQEKAREETTRRIAAASQEIELAKKAAIAELKVTAGQLALQVAERLLRKELANPAEQTRVVGQLIEELSVTPKN